MELVLTLVIFTVIATSPYLVMTGYVLLGGPRAARLFSGGKTHCCVTTT